MRILIYGMGGMGRFFHSFFFDRGYHVKGYDVVKERSETDTISGYDAIFICTPMDALEDAVRDVKERAESNPLLVDIASIKSVSIPILERSGFDYLSIHPMFGGDSEIGMSNIIIVRESGRDEERVILEEFRKAGAILSKLDFDRHDEMMAEIQGIGHFALLSMAYFLRFRKDDLCYASPIFSVLYKLASRILNQNWEMYYIIQKNAEKLREDYLKKAAELHERMKEKNEFRQIFEDLKSIYSDYENSTIILEAYKVSRDAESIEELRGYICAVDSLIRWLIERRVDAARKIAVEKKRRGEEIEVREVEESKIRDMIAKTNLNPVRMKEIFEGIMKLAKEEEYRITGVKKRIAVLGPKGSFSEEVALNLTGSRLPLKYCSTTDEVIKLVEEGEVDYGIVPIENSVNGTVLPVLDALMSYDVEVFGETRLEINHCLAAKRKLKMADIKAVYSHPQAIAQCMGFINNYLPHVEIRYTSSTSDAAAMLDENSAAIVSENAARLYKLYVLRKNIQDLKGRNVTRFYLIRRKTGRMDGKITSLFFGVEDRPGALRDVLDVFYRKGFNLRKLESRPSGLGLGDYVFFVEVEAPLREEDLKGLRDVTTFYKIVGVFDEVKELDVYG